MAYRYNWQFDGWKLEGVQWSAMPRQIPSLIALFMVVTFGSALDVAAIQQDTPFPLDFNQELVTVGEQCLGRPVRCDTAIPTTLDANAGLFKCCKEGSSGALSLQAFPMRWLAWLVPA